MSGAFAPPTPPRRATLRIHSLFGLYAQPSCSVSLNVRVNPIARRPFSRGCDTRVGESGAPTDATRPTAGLQLRRARGIGFTCAEEQRDSFCFEARARRRVHRWRAFTRAVIFTRARRSVIDGVLSRAAGERLVLRPPRAAAGAAAGCELALTYIGIWKIGYFRVSLGSV